MLDDLTNVIYAGVHVAPKAAAGGTVAYPSRDLIETLSSGQSIGGVPVNLQTTLGYAPVWACLNKIAGHVGTLPVSVYRRNTNDERRRDEDERHPAYWLLTYPNRYMTGQTFRETITWHALMGNGRALIVRNGRTDPSELIPLPPSNTVTILVKMDKDKNTSTEGDTGDAAAEGSEDWEKWHGTQYARGKWAWFPDSDVLHIPGLCYDGIRGYSVIDIAKQSLGLGMAAEKASAQHFKNGAKPSFMIKAPPGVFTKQEEAEKFLEDFNKRHAGSDNTGKVGMLRNGLDVAMMQQTPNDSQWIEQRKFQREEVALWFAIERLLGVESNTSYKSLEETNRAYVTNCLTRWLTKWEQEMGRKLLSEQQQFTESHYFRFTTAALLRGTTKERYEVYQLGRMMEVLSANEVRTMEDMPPREDGGGDDYANPSINPQQSGSNSQPATGGEDSTDGTAQNALRGVIESRLQELIKVECSRIIQACDKPKKFLAWLDDFYSDSEFGGRIINTYKCCKALSDDARQHIETSKSALLEASGTADGDGLKQAVESIVSEWHTRAAISAERITKELI